MDLLFDSWLALLSQKTKKCRLFSKDDTSCFLVLLIIVDSEKRKSALQFHLKLKDATYWDMIHRIHWTLKRKG